MRVGLNTVRYFDRAEAGRRVAAQLIALASARPVVFGLARGGVPVALEVARALGAPLDVLVVRKLGVPHHTELGMGAIAAGGARVMNEEVVALMRVPDRVIEMVTKEGETDVERREQAYRGTRPSLVVRGRTVVLVDDGLATGASMRAAVMAMRRQEAERIVVAVPVASAEARDRVAADGTEVVALTVPESLIAVGFWYENFGETLDEEVKRLLDRASRERPVDRLGSAAR